MLTRHTNKLKLFPVITLLEDAAIDLYGLLPRSTKGNFYLLVIMDRYSKLCRLITLSNVKSSTVAQAFSERWVCIHDQPKNLLSENGNQFMSKLFQDPCRVEERKTRYTTTYDPLSIDQIERFNRTIASFLRHYVSNDQRHWD